MIGQELGVEQAEPAIFKSCRQVNEGNFAGISCSREHAFTEECAGEPDAIEPSHYFVAAPDFHGMAAPEFEQFSIKRAYAIVYPRAFPPGSGFGAAFYDSFKIIIDTHFELFLADGTGEAPGDMYGVERQDPSAFRFNPVESAVLGAFSHGKNAARIGLEKHLRRNVDHDVVE